MAQKLTCSRCLSTSQGILTTVPSTVPNPLASACICAHHSRQLSTCAHHSAESTQACAPSLADAADSHMAHGMQRTVHACLQLRGAP